MRKKAAILLLCLAWCLTGCTAKTEDPDLAEIMDKMEVTENISGSDISGYPSLEGEETAYVKKTFTDVFNSIEQKENRLY